MDFLIPPTSAFENLSKTDSLSPATTALENLIISGRNTEKNKPCCKQSLINPAPMLSPEESFRLSYLTALIRLFYGPPKNCQSCTRLEVDASPHPSKSTASASAEERINQLRLHASERLSNQEKYQRFRYMYLKKKITGELSNLAEDKPGHREKLELVKSYVYQRQKQEEVLSIIWSVYTKTD